MKLDPETADLAIKSNLSIELVKVPPHRAGVKRSWLNNALSLKICDLCVVPWA